MKVILSLEPLADAAWKTHASGVQILVAPLPSERDGELEAESTKKKGNVDQQQLVRKVLPEVVKDWRGVGDKDGQPAACNAKAIEQLARTHGRTIGAWIVREARSLEHYLVAEVGEAKKD